MCLVHTAGGYSADPWKSPLRFWVRQADPLPEHRTCLQAPPPASCVTVARPLQASVFAAVKWAQQ